MKKPINSILILIVLFIYGAIVYKSVSGGGGVEDINAPNIVIPVDKAYKKATVQRDSFTITFGNGDPFLGKRFREKGKPLIDKKLIGTSKRKKTSLTSSWPSITYLGYIERTGISKTALLRINGKLYKRKVHDTVKGVKVVQIREDSIQLELKNNKRRFFVKTIR